MTDGLFRALCVDGKIHIGRPISGQSDILCVTDQNVQPQGVFLQIQEGHRPQRFAGIHAVDGTRIFEGDEVLVGKMRAVVGWDAEHAEFFLRYDGSLEEVIDDAQEGIFQILSRHI